MKLANIAFSAVASLMLVVTSTESFSSGNELVLAEKFHYEEVMRRDFSLVKKRKKRELATAVVTGVVTIVSGVLKFLMGHKAAKEAARQYDKTMQFKLFELCLAICVTEWSGWSDCSRNCGGGRRERKRTVERPGQCATIPNFHCPHSISQSEQCNMQCPNNGWPKAGGNCNCPPSWKGNCCQQEVRCPYPGAPKDGILNGHWPAKFEFVASFSCKRGFVLQGPEEKVCQGNDKWSPEERPKCAAISCNPPEVKNNSEILNRASSYDFDQEVYFRCISGYRLLHDNNVRRCERSLVGAGGRWSGYSPLCVPVECPMPGWPVNGRREGNGFQYDDIVQYSCLDGFKLIGQSKLTCLSSGVWNGVEPKCQEIKCNPPLIPDHSYVSSERTSFGAVVSFHCDDGYEIDEDRSSMIHCQEDGFWNATEPICRAIICGNPGIPDNGAKDGGVYTYGHRVSFMCFNGYQLNGVPEIICQRDQSWSHQIPTCKPCEIGSYLVESGACISCPPNSNTLTKASTDMRQCLCKDGYRGPPGGPCEKITCAPLLQPDNAILSHCQNLPGTFCNLTCSSGHILTDGNVVRRCLSDGTWDGTDASCAPCPIDSYKSGEGSCMPCPANAHTVTPGQDRDGCICNSGFSMDSSTQECIDINECNENNGKGPCDEVCQNTFGSYECHCSRPGASIDPDDQHKCIMELQCKNLTDVGPKNGGLVCHWYREESSQQCRIMCNKGFDFPDRVNDYETCSPGSNYTWSFRMNNPNALIQNCQPEFIPNFRMAADSYYFVRACKDLTESEKDDVKQMFVEVLNENEVCVKRGTKVCSVDDMAIICGNRKRRGTNGKDSVLIKFQVNSKFLDLSADKCPEFCQKYKIQNCDKYCLPYMRYYARNIVSQSRNIVGNLAKNQTRLNFNAASRQFTSTGIQSKGVDVRCDRGMYQDGGNCVACSAGMFLYKRLKRCLPCPIGTYNIITKQERCQICPPGSTTPKIGGLACVECPKGRFGRRCRGVCSACKHGSCDRVTGKCICQAGYEGELCDQDTDGCRQAKCSDGLKCHDVAVPGSGFQCIA